MKDLKINNRKMILREEFDRAKLGYLIDNHNQFKFTLSDEDGDKGTITLMKNYISYKFHKS